jgi:hypothetical protein
MKVIGYEGSPVSGHPLVWGAAAVRDERGVFNAVLPGKFQPRLDEDELRDAAVTLCEVEIPIEKVGPYFVADIAKDMASREPYRVEEDGIWPQLQKIVAIGHGPTRTYYVFESHEALQSWIYHMNAGKFALVPV